MQWRQDLKNQECLTFNSPNFDVFKPKKQHFWIKTRSVSRLNKYRNFLWIRSLLDKKSLPKFISPNLKLHNRYCRNKRLEAVRLGLDRRKVAIFDLKNFLRICYLGLDIIQDGTNDKYFDPKVAAWILKPGENEMTLSTLVMTYRPGMSDCLHFDKNR